MYAQFMCEVFNACARVYGIPSFDLWHNMIESADPEATMYSYMYDRKVISASELHYYLGE